MEVKEMHVRWTFTEDALGGLPENRDIHREYIASKAPDADGNVIGGNNKDAE